MSAKDVLKMISDNEAKFVDFRFTDTHGKEQHVSVPSKIVDEDMLTEGKQQYGDREIALIAVGGWARAVNLFATLAKDTGGEIPKGADVLKLRIVVDTLIEQVGTDAEVQPVVTALQEILPVASSAGRADAPPTAEDLAVLQSATGKILALVE